VCFCGSSLTDNWIVRIIRSSWRYDKCVECCQSNILYVWLSGARANIVYDSATVKYWWVFEDRSYTINANLIIRLASATNIVGPWTVEPGAIIQERGVFCMAPHIVKFGNTWYIYYGRSANGYEAPDVYVRASANVNGPYSGQGISNPVLGRGPAGAWDGLRAYEQYVFQANGLYYLFYMGQNGTSSAGSNAYELTGYATSSSPTGPFTKYSRNPILPPQNHGWDSGYDSLADPFVFDKNGVYYLGVSASSVPGYHSQRSAIGLYTTTDFINYVYSGELLAPAGGNLWDGVGTLRGAVSMFNGVYYLPYSGCDNTGNYRSGIATLSISEPIVPAPSTTALQIESDCPVESVAFLSKYSILDLSVAGSVETGFVQATISKTMLPSISSLKVYVNNLQTEYTCEDPGGSWTVTVIIESS